jgi:hypothetical protein
MTAVTTYQLNGLLITPPCPWLPPDMDAAAARVVHEAHASLGISEHPSGSNRGPQIDAWNRASGAPPASYWCASWAGGVWVRSGLTMPPGYGSCDAVMAWAKKTNRWSAHVPSFGAFVLYGRKGAPGQPDDAKHIGIVIQLEPLMSAEGNTTVEGATFERNGTAVALKLIDQHDPVLGYCHIHPQG